MFKWLKRISFFKKYREPVDTILKGLQSGKFEISKTEVMAGLVTVQRVELRQGACEVAITLTEYRVPFYQPDYTSSTDDWLTTEELQAVYGLAVALHNKALRSKADEIERLLARTKAAEQNARMLEVAKQLGVTNV